MSRDVNGNYTLPSGNPVVTGTVIASNWANTTLDDIATALTGSLDRSGNGAMLAQFEALAGSAGAPGISFATDLTTGLFLPSSGQMEFSTAGTSRMRITNSGAIAAGPSLTTFGINASGQVSVGGISPAAATRFSVIGDVLAESGGNTTAASFGPTIPNTVANQATMVRSAPNMPALSYTLPSLIHYRADGPLNIGVGSNVNINRGFYAGDTIGSTALANAYGFDGALVLDAVKNWNFYTSGSAPSYLADLRVGSTVQQNSAPLTATAAGTDNAASFFITGNNTSTRNVVWFGTTVDGNSGSITLNGVSVALASVSDYRRKENVAPLAGAVDRVNALKPIEFDWKGMNLPRHRGFLAHEFAEVYPAAVNGEKDAVDENGSPQYQMMSESAVITDLVGAVQYLLSRVAALESQIASNP
jgi:hypothetical protein